MFKLQSPSKCSSFDAIHVLRHFFSTAQNSFWTCWFWCLLVLLPFLVSPLPDQQNIFLWGLFLSGETKKSHSGWDLVNRQGGAAGHATSGQKLLNTAQCEQVRSHITHHGQMHWVFKKISLTPNAASHNNAIWYTDTGGFLEHSLSGGSLYYKGPILQKIILVFGGCSPL